MSSQVSGTGSPNKVNPQPTRITEKDIEKCKGRNQSFQVKAYSQLKALVKTGWFVTDERIEKFVLEDFKNQATANVYKNTVKPDETNDAIQNHVFSSSEAPRSQELEKIIHRTASKLIDKQGLQELNDYRLEAGSKAGIVYTSSPVIKKNESQEDVSLPSLLAKDTLTASEKTKLINHLIKSDSKKIQELGDQFKKIDVPILSVFLEMGGLNKLNLQQIQMLLERPDVSSETIQLLNKQKGILEGRI